MRERTSRTKGKNKLMRRCSHVRASAKGLLWWSKPFKHFVPYCHFLFMFGCSISHWFIFKFMNKPIGASGSESEFKALIWKKIHLRTNLKQVLKLPCVLKNWFFFFTIVDLKKHRIFIGLLNTFLIVQSHKNISFSVFCTNKLDTCKLTGQSF